MFSQLLSRFLYFTQLFVGKATPSGETIVNRSFLVIDGTNFPKVGGLRVYDQSTQTYVDVMWNGAGWVLVP